MANNNQPRNTRSKYWCFTFNNYSAGDPAVLEFTLHNAGTTYFVFGYETGESGTRHLQGYIEFTRRLRFNQVRSYLGEQVHIEPRRGTGQQAADYCKKDGVFVEYGTLSGVGRGHRTGRFFG